MSQNDDLPDWFMPRAKLDELLESPLEEPYKPYPPAPNYPRFYDYFCLCLDNLVNDDFMRDIEEPVYSCVTIYTPEKTPINFMFTAAVMDGADQQLDNVKLIPGTWSKKCHERLEALFQDLGGLADSLNLNIKVREIGPIFLIESDAPDDLLTLIKRYKTVSTFRTIDDEINGPFLTRGKSIDHCANRYRGYALDYYGVKDDHIGHERIDIAYLPPTQYLSRDFAYVAHQKTWDKETLGFSLTLLENILREEKGLLIQPGQGLVRYH